MAPRRRARAGQPRAPPSVTSLPDDLVLLCLEQLTQEERLRSVALVSKRFRALCLAPQLLRSLDVTIGGGAGSVLPRTAALLQFLAAHAAHVRELDIEIHPLSSGGADLLSDSQLQEAGENVAGALMECAAGALCSLLVGPETPLAGTAWLPALRHLQELYVGDADQPLFLPAASSQLTALAHADLLGSPLVLEGPLPPSLTRLSVQDEASAELPGQVCQLSALAWLELHRCKYSASSMERLTALTTLRRLDVIHAPALPASLPAMTWLEHLGAYPREPLEGGLADAWQEALGSALEALTRLTALALADDGQPYNLPAGTQLPQLQRLYSLTQSLPVALSGPCLASLRWLGLQWRVFELAVGPLRAAPHLRCVASLDAPTCIVEARWRAAWGFLATHPPLHRVYIDSTSALDEAALAAVEALQRLRPALQVLCLSSEDDPSFEDVAYEEFSDAPLLP